MQESLNLRKPQRFLVPTVLWLVVSALGCVLVARVELGRLRDDFQTTARIAHRLLSQRAVQHDAGNAGRRQTELCIAAGPHSCRRLAF